MHAVEPAYLICLGLAIFMFGAIGGFLTAALMLRRKRGIFGFGFTSGLLMGAILRRRLRALMASTVRLRF